MSEATAQSPSAYDRLATLEAMVTDNTSPTSPDSHLRRCQQEYESVAELSHGHDLCEEAAGTSGGASNSTIAPKWSIAASAATGRDSQVCASGSCFVSFTSLCMHSISCLDKALQLHALSYVRKPVTGASGPLLPPCPVGLSQG
jgi:hypothetical protein